jgi:hypothetical protein
MPPPNRYVVAGPHRIDLGHKLSLARWKEHPLPTDSVMIMAAAYDELIERLRELTDNYFQTGDVEAAKLFKARMQELKALVDKHPLVPPEKEDLVK